MRLQRSMVGYVWQWLHRIDGFADLRICGFADFANDGISMDTHTSTSLSMTASTHPSLKLRVTSPLSMAASTSPSYA
ncbi:MAG: hypothetical protein K9J16_00015 [Melioribacteraceae bacterium]|nr:hypothetical protein [Melioribacteraceae bacterium]MCF8392650.1 hypothetical protein [Melioribacteraceae bacterium]MCF8417671.1 hypothetical protein [Melioribacteraceae bacterium]